MICSIKTSCWIHSCYRALSFFDPELKLGFSLPYPYIAIHATSKKEIHTSSPAESSGSIREQPCVYCQIDSPTQQDSDDFEDVTDLNIFPDSEDESTSSENVVASSDEGDENSEL